MSLRLCYSYEYYYYYYYYYYYFYYELRPKTQPWLTCHYQAGGVVETARPGASRVVRGYIRA